MLKKMCIISIFMINSLLAELTKSQVNLLNTVYSEGKQYKAHDNFSFEKTLCAIYITESSAGKYIIGDKYTDTGTLKPLYLSSLGPGQIKLETALLVLNKYPVLQKKFNVKSHNIAIFQKYVRLIQQEQYLVSILSSLRETLHNWNSGRSKKYYQLINRIRQVSRRIHYVKAKLKRYKKYILQADIIINKLLNNVKFSVAISSEYLIYNYEIAKHNKMYKPYLKAISRYNGGWMNYKYIHRVMKNLRYVRKLIRKGVIQK